MGKLSKIQIKSLLRDITDSIVGSRADYTGISLRRAILLLSIPMILEMVMESVFALVDIYFVAKINTDAVAAVGFTESIMTLIYAVGIGFSAATGAMVARRCGEKKPKEAANATIQIIIICVTGSLLFAIPGTIFAKDLLKLMGASAQTIATGSVYTAIMLGSNAVILLLFVINAAFRSAGAATTSMRVLWIANILNIFLDPCFIFGFGPFPQLGVKGAAIATCIGRGIGVLYQLFVLFKGNSRLKIFLKQIKLDFTIIKQLLQLSLGGIAQMIIATSSWIGLVIIIAQFGSEAVAGYTIALRLIIFTLVPSWGFSNAAATLVGQNLGAQKSDRAERSVWLTNFTNMAIMGLSSLFLFLFADFFIGLFKQVSNVHQSGSLALRFLSVGLVFNAMGMVISHAFNGAGDTITPTKINFICFWLLEIPLAWILANPMGLHEKGVYISILISESLLSIIAAILFRRGGWKTKQV